MTTDLVLTLTAGPDNPRNSEGAFITLRNGNILFAYSRYTGESWSDHATTDIAARCSTDRGQTWSTDDRLLVANEGQCNVMSVSLLRLHDGRIALFYVQKNSGVDCRLRLRTSSDEGGTWSDAVIGNPGSGYFVTNNDRVIQLASGRLLAPAAYHRPKTADSDLGAGIANQGEAVFFVSDDAGQSWRETTTRLRVGQEIHSGLQEPGVIERRGGSLYGWARTSEGRQWEFTSTDGGETWTEPSPSTFRSPTSPLSLKAITPDPIWLAVWNDRETPGHRRIRIRSGFELGPHPTRPRHESRRGRHVVNASTDRGRPAAGLLLHRDSLRRRRSPARLLLRRARNRRAPEHLPPSSE